MLTKAENNRLTRVGPGTPIGQLLRRYWHPFATTAQIASCEAFSTRILGEDLVLYRGQHGLYGLGWHQCRNVERDIRLVSNAVGIESRQCFCHTVKLEELGLGLDSKLGSFKNSQRQCSNRNALRMYPVQELGGMLFVYLGPEPVPLLPNWDLFVAEEVVRDIGYASIPCNWLQIMENSLDPVHVEWLHQGFFNFVSEELNRPDLGRPRTPHRKIAFDLFDHGIVKRRVVGKGSEKDDDWRIGHPIVFPNILKTGNIALKGRGACFQIRVPIDDTQTAHWWYSCYSKESEHREQDFGDVPFYQVPVPTLDSDGQPVWKDLDNTSGQDIAAWVSQGAIADRTNETLGRSDKGIVLYRRLLEEQLALVENGEDPMNIFRDAKENVDLILETEGRSARYAKSLHIGRRAATKFSPILAAQGYGEKVV